MFIAKEDDLLEDIGRLYPRALGLFFLIFLDEMGLLGYMKAGELSISSISIFKGGIFE